MVLDGCEIEIEVCALKWIKFVQSERLNSKSDWWLQVREILPNYQSFNLQVQFKVVLYQCQLNVSWNIPFQWRSSAEMCILCALNHATISYITQHDRSELKRCHQFKMQRHLNNVGALHINHEYWTSWICY